MIEYISLKKQVGVHFGNSTVYGYNLFFIELDGNIKKIYYDIEQKQQMDEALSILEAKCPNIIIGWTNKWTVYTSVAKNINPDNKNSNYVLSLRTPEEKSDDQKLRAIISSYEKNEK